jgi:hypothetical protein
MQPLALPEVMTMAFSGSVNMMTGAKIETRNSVVTLIAITSNRAMPRMMSIATMRLAGAMGRASVVAPGRKAAFGDRTLAAEKRRAPHREAGEMRQRCS